MKNDHPITEMADALEVSASGYADHQCKAARPRRQQDELIARELQGVFEQSGWTYGNPRLQASLRSKGHRIGKNRIARLHSSLGYKSPLEFESSTTYTLN